MKVQLTTRIKHPERGFNEKRVHMEDIQSSPYYTTCNMLVIKICYFTPIPKSKNQKFIYSASKFNNVVTETKNGNDLDFSKHKIYK